MNHICIPGTEPSSVILNHTKKLKTLKVISQECKKKKAKAKRDGVITPPPPKKKTISVKAA